MVDVEVPLSLENPPIRIFSRENWHLKPPAPMPHATSPYDRVPNSVGTQPPPTRLGPSVRPPGPTSATPECSRVFSLIWADPSDPLPIVSSPPPLSTVVPFCPAMVVTNLYVSSIDHRDRTRFCAICSNVHSIPGILCNCSFTISNFCSIKSILACIFFWAIRIV